MADAPITAHALRCPHDGCPFVSVAVDRGDAMDTLLNHDETVHVPVASAIGWTLLVALLNLPASTALRA